MLSVYTELCNKPSFVDLFEKIVPIPVYDAMNVFEGRKSTITNMEIGRLREQTTLLNSVLASLNLPAALEDVGGDKVPQSVLDKAQQVRDMGGVAYLEGLMRELPELLTRNREILDESVRMLDEEEKSDTQLKEQFKERWTRTASGHLTKPMRDESGKYKGILDTAINADKIVQDKYRNHKNAIALLSKPTHEIERSLPSGGGGGLAGNPHVKELKKMMEEVEAIKAEREVIETELKESKFDMAGKFMAALAADGLVNEEALSQKELGRCVWAAETAVCGQLSETGHAAGQDTEHKHCVCAVQIREPGRGPERGHVERSGSGLRWLHGAQGKSRGGN
ncbi:hypothetical protein DPMN_056792 [Dreissena polymorpha]|uniref:ALIX V-shaped domain-containing protein n=1 Tax=Dreissena polymorpha TaxID=45954 RepID=A0A9D4HTJ0_DREPO|nr:hypothetical protein DPMN_056792 [Dreissena polymorpha]